MAKYLSNKFKSLKIGLDGFSDNKTSLTIVGKVGVGATLTLDSVTGIISAVSFKKIGGTSSQFLMADGSTNTSTFLTSYTETDTLNNVLGRGNVSGIGLSVGVVTATSFNGTINTAAQPNITSLGTLTGLTVNGDASFTTANGNNIVFDKSANDLVFGDSVYLRFGAGDDLAIAHDGSNSYIQDNGTGDLVIAGSQIRLKSANTLEDMLKATENGGVQLYYDNSSKLETISTGVRMQNTSVFDVNGGTIQFGHSSSTDDRLKFGANDTDLQIFHGGNGQFDVNTGDVIIRNTGDFSSSREIYLMARVDEQSVTCFSDGSVELYYDNALQVKTVSDGIQLQTDKFISRHPNSNTQIIEVTNAQYAKSIYFGGWDGGTNSSGISRVRNSNDNLHIDAGSGGTLYLMAYSDNVTMCRHFRPMSDDTYDLGGGGVRWDDVFATNGTINTSDRTLKNTIVDSDLGLSFINKLKPVSYKFNGKTRTHYGLIAQDVETVLSDISKPSTDFAGFIKTDLPDEYYQEAEPHIPEGKKEGDLKSAAHTEYGLRYTEFISPLIKAVQELSAKNDALEARIAALEG